MESEKSKSFAQSDEGKFTVRLLEANRRGDVETLTNLAPNSQEYYEWWLGERYHIGMAAEWQKEVYGIMMYVTYRGHTRLQCLHVLNFAVREHERRDDVGNIMTKHLIKKCAALGLDRIFLEVQGDHVQTLRLLKKHHFGAIGIRTGNGNDTYIMTYPFDGYVDAEDSWPKSVNSGVRWLRPQPNS